MDLDELKKQHKDLMEQWHKIKKKIDKLDKEEKENSANLEMRKLLQREKIILNKMEKMIFGRIESLYFQLSEKQDK